MSNILTVVRRDLATYFTSPIGYIFMMVYLLISVGLYITSFFTFPVADMRAYFTNLPLLLCVFIPAVTMRVWAEERKENTWEMLLTFPMQGWEIVLGKFLACFAFLAATLLATITVPVMLVVLGNPDNGAILGGYVGTLLIGGFFLSIGIFFSGFCKDQIVAFVVTLLVCFLIFLLGTNFIAGYVDGVVPGLGSLLAELVGVVDHYNAFARGVIEIGDVMYFVAWTALFLVLNMMYIEGRSRPRARLTFGGAVATCVAIGLVFNWLLTGQSFGRFDLTEDKIYTISDASKSVLSKLDVPVQVKVYITPKNKMPTGMTQLEQDITDKLDELSVASGGKLSYSTVYLEAANVLADANESLNQDKEEEKDEGKAIEKRMLDKGVEPFAVRAMSQDEFTNKLVYSSIGVAYRDKAEEIIPQVMPETLPELEYRLINTVYKLTRTKAPVVALVAPEEAVNIPPEMRQMYMQMGQPIPTSEDPYIYLQELLRHEKYDVKRVQLTKDSPLPDEYDALVVVNPRSLSDRQRWEFNRALVSGKSVVLAVQNYEWDYQTTRNGISINKREENPMVNDLLEKYGLGVDEDILMDVNHVPLTIQSGGGALAQLLGMGQTINLPIQMLLSGNSMDSETSITSHLDPIFYLWGSALKLNDEELKKHGLQAKTLISTTDKAWSVAKSAPLTQASFDPPASGKRYPVMAMVTGQFPDAFKDAPRPTWPVERPRPGEPPRPETPDNEPDAKPVTPAPGKIVLLGCSQLFRKEFLQRGSGNLDLFLNSVDAITLGDELVNVRGRKPIDRVIDMPSAGQKRLWKFVNYALTNLVIAGVGISTAVLRRRSRNAYTMTFAETED
ncbi:MAG: Gldg family protein [Candidatus Hydrogenedentes bacterium]|nr:Gldg family protein [Candidatus Hydrogenedentota bacterium]